MNNFEIYNLVNTEINKYHIKNEILIKLIIYITNFLKLY